MIIKLLWLYVCSKGGFDFAEAVLDVKGSNHFKLFVIMFVVWSWQDWAWSDISSVFWKWSQNCPKIVWEQTTTTVGCLVDILNSLRTNVNKVYWNYWKAYGYGGFCRASTQIRGVISPQCRNEVKCDERQLVYSQIRHHFDLTCSCVVLWAGFLWNY